MNADEFIAGEEQKHIEMLWSSRNVVTGADLDFLAELKIVYGGCCGLELNASPKIKREGNPCIYCGKMSSHYTLYVCERYRKTRCCKAIGYDRAFLQSCGIAVEPARGVVTVQIEMQGECVRKARKRHALRKRKPLRGERRATSCGHYNLGEFAI